ncbi:MAG TPA: peptidase domain-containing ABC transporter [Rhodanobacteraceae bacterium]
MDLRTAVRHGQTRNGQKVMNVRAEDLPMQDAIAGGRGEIPDGVVVPEPRLHFGWGKHLPMIRQSESGECALACLAMIAGYHGQHVDLPGLRQRFATSLKGTTLNRLIDIAQTLGLACRPLRLDMHELSRLQMPCILHWDLDHFVVLRKTSKRHAIIHDPAVGERRLQLADVSPHWTGVAIELSQGPTFKRKAPPPPVSLRTLAGSIEGLSKALTIIFSLALLLELIELLWPQFLQMTIDQVLADGDHSLLTFLGLSFLLLLAMRTVVSALRTWTVMWLGTHFNLSWVGNVFQHLLRLPQDYFLKRHLGDIVSKFGAVSAIQQTVTTQFVTVIIDGVMASLTLIVMLLYSATLTAIVALAVALYAVTRVLYYRAYFASNLSQITVRAKQQSVFMEAVRGVQTLRLHNRGPAHTARYLNAAADTLNMPIKVQKLNLLFSSVSGLTNGAQRIGVLWLGAYLALGGHISAGMLMAYVAYADQFSSRASSLVEYLVQLKLLRLQGERLADIVLTAPEHHTTGNRAGPLPEPSVRFEHVSFAYAPGEPMVLKDASFEVKAGEAIVITGPSGGGKSTLVRLLLGLLDPQQGDIRIGGVSLKQLGKQAWRSMVGSVMQDDTLFAGTIADNISFHDETATQDRIEAAAKLAQIHDDIVTMPMAYHTLVGDMGSALSGGQKQRLFLARAFYKQPKVLVLDEATSHLDVECERKINAALRALDITRIVIAHRPETMQAADRVLLCLQGRVRAIDLNTGTPHEAVRPATGEVTEVVDG